MRQKGSASAGMELAWPGRHASTAQHHVAAHLWRGRRHSAQQQRGHQAQSLRRRPADARQRHERHAAQQQRRQQAQRQHAADVSKLQSGRRGTGRGKARGGMKQVAAFVLLDMSLAEPSADVMHACECSVQQCRER